MFGAIALGDSLNPFATDLTDLIGIRTDRATARSNRNSRPALVHRPRRPSFPPADRGHDRRAAAVEPAALEQHLLDLWRQRPFPPLRAIDPRRARSSADQPRQQFPAPKSANSRATAEYTRVHFSDAGTLNHHALGLTWEPRPPLRLRATIERDRPARRRSRSLGNPVIVSPDVRMFDPLTGETVDVVQITGGNPDLRPEKTKSAA